MATIMYAERRGVNGLFKSLRIAKFFDEKMQQEAEDYGRKIIFEELSLGLLKEMEKSDIAVQLVPLVKSEVSYGFDHQEVELRGEIRFRPFKFCKDCSCLSQTEFNGGYCTRMNDLVHITDGCTSSPDLEKR